MRVLFTIIPEKGHINPYIPVAQKLMAMGHIVAFHAAADIRDQLTTAGFSEFLGMDHLAEPADANRGKLFADKINDKGWLRGWIKNLLIDQASPQVEPLRVHIKSWKPDIIVTDPMVYPAVIAATLENIPCIAVSNSLNPVLQPEITSELLNTVRWLEEDRDNLFSSFGLKKQKFSGCDWISPLLTACFTTSVFIGKDIPGVTQVGPSCQPRIRGDETAFPFDKIDPEKKKVLVSFGSQIYFQPRRFGNIIEALRDMDVQLIISASELADSALWDTTPNDTIIARYIPQMAVLPYIDAFITHGGANSVMEALYHSVPMAISPICNDQFHQAWFIEQAGCGVCVDTETASTQEIASAVKQCLFDTQIIAKTREISQDYRRHDGSSALAHLIADKWSGT